MRRDCEDFVKEYKKIPEKDLGPQKEPVLVNFLSEVRIRIS